MSRTLLIVSAGIEAIPGIRRAREMGLRVVVSDANPNAPGIAEADDFLHADTYDGEATLAAARRYHAETAPLSGVMTVAADVPVTVATVAAGLGLPGIPLEAARLAMDKLAMKRRFAADGVPVPWFAPLADARELREVVGREGLPLVIKPVDSRGARGVLRLTGDPDALDLEAAFAASRAHSPSGRVMVERYLEGPQVSTETVMLDGVAHTPGFSDRNYERLERHAPHIIEDGGELPSFLPEALQGRVRELVGRAALSMGIRHGTVKGDIVVHDGKPYVIELAARLSGGYFCSHEIPLNTGVDFLGAAIRLALGEPVSAAEVTPRFQRCVAQRYLFPEPGEVVSAALEAWLADDPELPLVELRLAPGDRAQPIHSHPARGGVVIATGADRAAALAKAQAAIAAMHVVTRP